MKGSGSLHSRLRAYNQIVMTFSLGLRCCATQRKSLMFALKTHTRPSRSPRTDMLSDQTGCTSATPAKSWEAILMFPLFGGDLPLPGWVYLCMSLLILLILDRVTNGPFSYTRFNHFEFMPVCSLGRRRSGVCRAKFRYIRESIKDLRVRGRHDHI